MAFITYQQFKDGLKNWLPEKLRLDDVAVKKLLLRLDEYDTGRVSITVLDDFAGIGSLIAKLVAYSPRSWLPLIVWVDDRPENNQSYVLAARKAGLKVVEFTSTAEAKVWIDENLGASLRLNGSDSRFLVCP